MRGLAKYYGAYQAIEALDFSIARGEIVGLLGLNGAGKSTVLKILGAFLVPSAGYAEVAGCSIADNPQGVRRAIGFLPDSPPLYHEMSVDAYLDYVLRLKVGCISRADLDRQRDEALDRTALTAERSRTLGELSHGFAQRVGIAQAIIHKPPVLILDEPINGLDPVQIVEMRDLILSFRNEHTVILSSHILSEITRTCDRILILDQGRLVAQGTEAELAKSMHSGKAITAKTAKDPQSALANIKKISGVDDITCQQSTLGEYVLTIQIASDVRSQVARQLVEFDLLTLNAAEDGLEALFMQLVSSDSSRELESGKKLGSGRELGSGKKLGSGRELESGRELGSGKESREAESGRELESGKELAKLESGKELAKLRNKRSEMEQQ